MLPAPLARDEVHVWNIDLNRDPSPFLDLLSVEELRRAECFRFEQDREHFLVARGMLRALLARYLGAAPTALCFVYGEHGKPRLVAPETGLRFNLSHSHGRALIAVAEGRDVGVDLEYVHRRVAEERVARRYFSPEEVAALRALPPAERKAAFFRGWSRKEAYLKARGDGIHYGLRHFTVSLAPDEPAALLANTLHPEEVTRWTLRNLDVGPDFAACVAAEGSGWTLRAFDASRLPAG